MDLLDTFDPSSSVMIDLLAFCFRFKGKQRSTMSFAEWLARKESIETHRRDVKRLIKEKKAIEEEDRLAATD